MISRSWAHLCAANAAMERFEREHPVAWAFVAIPVCLLGVMLVAYAPLILEVVR